MAVFSALCVGPAIAMLVRREEDGHELVSHGNREPSGLRTDSLVRTRDGHSQQDDEHGKSIQRTRTPRSP